MVLSSTSSRVSLSHEDQQLLRSCSSHQCLGQYEHVSGLLMRTQGLQSRLAAQILSRADFGNAESASCFDSTVSHWVCQWS